MSAFVFAAFAVWHLISFEINLDHVIRSDAVGIAVTLATLVAVPAISAIATHNVIAGPLRRASRRKSPTCIKCGYNLTGNISGVCPECGTACEEDARPA